MISTIFIGRTVNDPEMRVTKGGKNVCNFRIATRTSQKERDGSWHTEFAAITAWDKKAEICCNNLSKGKLVAVVGEPTVEAFIDKNGNARAQMKITLEKIEFLTPKSESAHVETSGEEDEPGADQFVEVPNNDEIPF